MLNKLVIFQMFSQRISTLNIVALVLIISSLIKQYIAAGEH